MLQECNLFCPSVDWFIIKCVVRDGERVTWLVWWVGEHCSPSLSVPPFIEQMTISYNSITKNNMLIKAQHLDSFIQQLAIHLLLISQVIYIPDALLSKPGGTLLYPVHELLQLVSHWANDWSKHCLRQKQLVIQNNILLIQENMSAYILVYAYMKQFCSTMTLLYARV